MENKSEEKEKMLSKFIEPYVRTKIILGIILLLIIGSILLWIGFNKSENLYFYLLREIGKATIITALVSSTFKWYFGRQFALIEEEKEKTERQLHEEREEFEREKDELFREEVNNQLEILREKVLSQTKEIASQATCIDAIQAANVDRFYQNRGEASEDIKNTLLRESVEEIKMIGISLNDFMRDENEMLHQAWLSLRKYIEDDDPPVGSEKLDIKVLIIDYRSNGAYLRGKAEGEEGLDTRLPSDVADTMRDLLSLQKWFDISNSSNLQKRRVTFDAKVYRTCPILHLVWTPYAAFVQPYHFRPRHSKSRIPIIKYHNSGELDCVHQELNFHFQWIWNNAAVPLKDHMIMNCIGVDDAIREANINNIYYNTDESKTRIIKMIQKTDKILWIKGISLHSFFTHGDLYDALSNACRRKVDVKVLLINPNSHQAVLRSFREYLISHPNSQLSNYDDSARKSERLYMDTINSINFINIQLMRRIGYKTKFNVKLYESSPESFTLITDGEVLVEQYHYGKIIDRLTENQPDVILGGDVPVLEYQKMPDDKMHDKRRDPYKLFKDNFDYTFKYCSKHINEFNIR